MKTSLFDFHLPEQQIAQAPLADRDASRLLALDRSTQIWADRNVRDLHEYFRPGDLLILNDTRVIPARLRAARDSSGGKVEFLLLPPEPQGSGFGVQGSGNSTIRRVLTKSGGKLKIGESFTLMNGPKVILRERQMEVGDVIEIRCPDAEFESYIRAHGEVPLPPYIRREAGPSAVLDVQRYQTVYAQNPGAVAAPTAGLHFSDALLEKVRSGGILIERLTLHVGPGTFRPVKADNVEEHFVDPEPYTIPARTVAAIRSAKREGRRVIAVGTTSLRTLEGADFGSASDTEIQGSTNLYVYPPYKFSVVDALLTNFHIPKSSLLMLVCAFASPGSEAGIALIQRAYEHAVKSGYRFYSYGDACFIH